MKQSRPLDFVCLALCGGSGLLYGVGTPYFDRLAVEAFDPMPRNIFHATLRPVFFLLLGYALAWLFLVPLAEGAFRLRKGAAAGVLVLCGLGAAAYLLFALLFWGLVPVPGLSLPLWAVELYGGGYFLVPMGSALCTALRKREAPGP